jgi:hypothetical protein
MNPEQFGNNESPEILEEKNSAWMERAREGLHAIEAIGLGAGTGVAGALILKALGIEVPPEFVGVMGAAATYRYWTGFSQSEKSE